MSKIEASAYTQYNKIAMKTQFQKNNEQYQNVQNLFQSHDSFVKEFSQFERSADPKRVQQVKEGFFALGQDMASSLFNSKEIQSAVEYIDELSKVILRHV